MESTSRDRPDPAWPWLSRPILWGAPLLAGGLAYANTLANGFTLDDTHFVIENLALESASAALPWRAITTSEGVFFRPVGIASLVLDRALYGLWAPGFHLTSLLVHLAATAAVITLASRLGTRSLAFVAALIFAVHPVHTEAVSNIANRPEVLATLFGMLALTFFARTTERPGRQLGLANLCILLALLSKESAITIPPIALALDLFVLRRKRPLARAAALLPATFLYLALRAHALGALTFDPSLGYFHGHSNLVRLYTTLSILPRYGQLLLAPYPLSASYTRTTIADLDALDASVASGVLLVVSTVGLIVLLARRVPLVAFGLASFCLALLPYLHLTTLGSILAERFLYLPSVGFVLAAAALFQHALPRLLAPRLTLTVLASLTMSLALLTAERNLDWRDDVTLWRVTYETYPDNRFAQTSLGIALCKAGREYEGLSYLDPAFRFSLAPSIWSSTAACYFHAGQFARAAAVARTGLKRFPGRTPELGQTLAISLAKLGDMPSAFAESIAHLRAHPSPNAEGLVRLLAGHHADPARVLRTAAEQETPGAARDTLLRLAHDFPTRD